MIKPIIILYFCMVFLGCNRKPADVSDQSFSYKSKKPNTIITCEIMNAPEAFVVLIKDSFRDTVYFDAQNRVKFALYLSQPTYFKVSDGKSNFKIHIEPKDDLQIAFNSNNIFNTIQFLGKGAEPNNYIKEKYLLMLNYALPLEHLYEKPVKEFRHLVDSFYVINKMYFDEFTSKNSNLSETFKSTEMAAITYDRAAQLMEYLNATSYSNTINETNYLKFLDQLSVNESQLLEIYEYKLFLSTYIEFYAGKKFKTENLAQHEITLIKLQTVSDKIHNQDVKDNLLFTFLRDHVKYYGYKNTELLFKTFEMQCKNEKMREGILLPYNEYIKLSQKQKAPEINMIDVYGNPVNIQNFNGTYLYIDVWATWCMPCRKEMPFFDALKDKYKHKNIEFISISIDQKHEDWLEFLTLKNLKQNHFLATDIQLFLDAYMIKTIPHFLIIDDKGNLINNNAPRPSDNNTEWLNEIPDKQGV